MDASTREMPPVLEVSGLSKSYGKLEALRSADLKVEKGEIVGLIGPNGAGKTTLIECALGLKEPTAGEAKVMGINVATNHSEAASHFGAQFQESSLPPFTRVADIFWLWKGLYKSKEKPQELCEEFGIGDKYKSTFRTLSGGQKRRALIALAFFGNPEIVVLDEPTSGMDPSARSIFWESVRKRTLDGTSVLITSHELLEMDINCDRIAMIFDGEIATVGTVDEVIKGENATVTLVALPRRDPNIVRSAIDNLPTVSGVVWASYVQGALRIVASANTVQAELKEFLVAAGFEEGRITFRPSNIEDIFYILNSRSKTAGGTK